MFLSDTVTLKRCHQHAVGPVSFRGRSGLGCRRGPLALTVTQAGVCASAVRRRRLRPLPLWPLSAEPTKGRSAALGTRVPRLVVVSIMLLSRYANNRRLMLRPN